MADTTHAAVVSIVQTSNGALCSGTLVGPSVVLTAAHCVYGVGPSDLHVFVGPDQSAPEQTLDVQSVAAYPTYSGEATGLSGGVDLGVIYLAAPLGIPPMPPRTSATDADLTGSDVTLVGYGRNTTTDSTGAGVRRSVTLPVHAVCSRILTLGDETANECFGDSGGAVLLGDQLVAVISSGKPDCIAPSKQVRLSAHTAWLDAALNGNAGAPCPACVQPDPSCDALVEGEPAKPDAGQVDAASDAASGAPAASGSGGCSVCAPPKVSAWSLAAVVSLGLLARFRRRSRRGARPRHGSVAPHLHDGSSE